MKIGLFGGTFDPIHIGHLIIADAARQAVGLDRVVFIPSARPPHKTDETITPFSDRLAMVQLAVDGHAGFEVSDIESREDGLSFTVSTVSYYRRMHPQDDLYLIIGADSLINLPSWKDPEQLTALAHFVVYPRTGYDMTDAKPVFLENSLILTDPMVEVSSSWIRDAMRMGRSVRFWLPPGVFEYLLSHQLAD